MILMHDPEKSEAGIADPPFILVVGGSSLSPGPSPHPTIWDLVWLYTIYSSRVMDADRPTFSEF